MHAVITRGFGLVSQPGSLPGPSPMPPGICEILEAGVRGATRRAHHLPKLLAGKLAGQDSAQAPTWLINGVPGPLKASIPPENNFLVGCTHLTLFTE